MGQSTLTWLISGLGSIDPYGDKSLTWHDTSLTCQHELLYNLWTRHELHTRNKQIRLTVNVFWIKKRLTHFDLINKWVLSHIAGYPYCDTTQPQPANTNYHHYVEGILNCKVLSSSFEQIVLSHVKKRW